MADPMTERRLSAIEDEASWSCEQGDSKHMSRVCANDVPDLIAEVRRLQADMKALTDALKTSVRVQGVAQQ